MENWKICVRGLGWGILTLLLPLGLFSFGFIISDIWMKARISDYQVDCLGIGNLISQRIIERDLKENQPFCQDPNLINILSGVSEKNKIYSFGTIWSEHSITNIKVHLCQEGRKVIEVKTNTGYFGFKNVTFCLLEENSKYLLFSAKDNFQNVTIKFPEDSSSIKISSEKGREIFRSNLNEGKSNLTFLDGGVFPILSAAPFVLNLSFVKVFRNYVIDAPNKFRILQYSVYHFTFLCIFSLNILFMFLKNGGPSFLLIVHVSLGKAALILGLAVFHRTFGKMGNSETEIFTDCEMYTSKTLTFIFYFLLLPVISSFFIHYILLICTYNFVPVILLNSLLLIKIILVLKKKGRSSSFGFSISASFTLTLVLNYVFCFTNRHSVVMAWVYFIIIYTIQFGLTAFYYLQLKIGAWFFLPLKYRMNHPDYLQKISETYSVGDIAGSEIPCCDLCTDLLTEPPIEFLDPEIRDNKFYKVIRKENDIFVGLDCHHNFHFECIFPIIVDSQGKCPLCSEQNEPNFYFVEKIRITDGLDSDY